MTLKAGITILVDNMPGEGLRNSWGFSAYIEADRWTVLFDADTDPEVLKYNINKLNINLNKLKLAVLSHHHADHYGGFKYIAKVRPGLEVYIPPGSSEYLRKIGLKPITVYNPMRLFKDSWLTGPLRSFTLYEQAFSFYISNKGLVVLVGCSHPGVDKLAMQAKEISNHDIYWVIGGYHSPKRETIDKLARISRYISPAHCSGEYAKEYVKRRYGDKYIEVRTGSRFNI